MVAPAVPEQAQIRGQRLEADATIRTDFIGQFLPNSPISRQYLAIFLLSRHYLAIISP